MIQLRTNRGSKPTPKPRGKSLDGKSVRFSIPRAALALWYFTEDTSGNRLNLQHIHIEPEVTYVGKTKHIKAHAVATDGHRLMHVWWDPKSGEKFAEKVWLHRVAVERHLREATEKGGSIFARGKEFEYEVMDRGSNFILRDSSGRTSVVFEDPGSQWEFPQWRQVMPTRDDSESTTPQTYGVNLNYLDDLRKYLDEFNGKSWNGNLGIKINYVNPPLGPMLIVPAFQEEGAEVEIEYGLKMGKGASMEYVVMPMRVD